MKSVRQVLVLAVVAAGALALSASGGAVPKPRAVAAALAFLKPQAVKGSVVVYGLPAPLRSGVSIVEAGVSGKLSANRRSPFTVPVRSWRLKERAWLFWEDLAPGAGFTHASRLVLVDDRTGKVTVSAALSWWPLVDGRLPPFVRRPSDRRYQVYRRSTRAFAAKGRALLSTRGPTATAFTGENDCYVYVAALADFSNPTFGPDNEAMLNWAQKRKLPHPDRNPADAATLAAQIKELTDKGCTDVVIFVRGHGYAPPGAPPPLATSDVARVKLKSLVERAGGGWQIQETDLTSVDIANIVRRYVETRADGKVVAKVHFKLIVDSCFSGRFIEDLAPLQAVDDDHPDPPLRVVVASSAANRLTNDAFDTEPPRTSHWITQFLKAFDEVTNDKQVTESLSGDLAATIAAAAEKAKEEADQTGGDELVRRNDPQSSLSSGPVHPIGEPREAASVTIRHSAAWTHNQPLMKSSACINVETTPPQAFISAELTGPGGFDLTTNGKQPLHPDGTGQIRATITTVGDYTLQDVTYDASGNTTGSASVMFTVKFPANQAPAFGPACEAPTQ